MKNSILYFAIALLTSLFIKNSITQVLPHPNQIDQWKTIKSTSEDELKILWDLETGTPSVIRGGKIDYVSLDFISTATTFFNAKKELLKYREQLDGFKIKKTSSSEEKFKVVILTQTYKGIPVYLGEYKLVFNNQQIKTIAGKYYPDINVTINPKISGKEAVNVVADNIKSFSDFYVQSNELMILPEKNNNYLCWVVFIRKKGFPGSFKIFIEANSGKIIKKVDMTCCAIKPGEVFPIDPEQSGLSVRPLYRLDGDGSKTYGQYVQSIWASELIEPRPTYEPYTGFNPPIYSVDETEFDGVNLYYHVDRYLKYFIAFHQFGNLEQPLKAKHHWWGDNSIKAQYDNGIVIFGHGDMRPGHMTQYYDLAKKDDIIYHEVQHAVSEQYGLGYTNAYCQAINEGFSDYFAASFTNDPVIGEWVCPASDKGHIRTCSNNKNYFHKDNFNLVEYAENTLVPNGWINPRYSAHARGMIWSGALWDIRQAIGYSYIADHIFLKSYTYTGSNPDDFVDAREGVLDAENELYGGSYKEIIEQKFYERGIGDPPGGIQFNVSIDGPIGLLFKQIGTWEAIVDPPGSDYHYQWWKKTDGTSTWQQLDTMSTQSIMMLTTGFDLRVVVTDGEHVDDATKHVTYGLPKEAVPGEEVTSNIPDKFSLSQNYPNPFNPQTQIRFGLPQDTQVELSIYTIDGEKVITLKNEFMNAGFHSIEWNGTSNNGKLVGSGIYFYVLRTRNFVQSKKMVYLK